MTERLPLLTPAQSLVLDTIREMARENEVMPTLDELANRMGVSKCTIWGHLDSLERKGRITRKKYQARAIVLHGEACPCCGQWMPEQAARQSREAQHV